MQKPTTAEITLRVRVKFDADIWDGNLDEIAIDLSERLFLSNDDGAEEAVEVLYTQTIDAQEVSR